MRVIEIKEYSQELQIAVEKLVSQLTNSKPPTKTDMEEIIRSSSSFLFVAVDNDYMNSILGIITLVVFRIPTGLRAMIEDVVVDENLRRRGIGSLLIRHAIDHARMLRARTVDLTSRPSREAANNLYRKIGFKLRDTNVYRFSIDF